MRNGIHAETGPRVAAAVLCGAVLLLAACKKSDANGAADSTATARMDSSSSANMAPANTTPTAQSSAAMTDAQIFARLIAANQGEVAAGKMAVSKATNADVKAFARQMVADHTKMLNDVTGLSKRLNVTPDSVAASDIVNSNKMMADQLTAAAKGATFDTAYVNGQVGGHQAALDMIQSAAGQTQNDDLKKALNGAIPVVQHHLDRIKSIQDKMK